MTHDEALKNYPQLGQLIGGEFRTGGGRQRAPVFNPSRNAQIADYEMATESDLDDALTLARHGFETWRALSSHDRGGILRQIAFTLRDRQKQLASIVALELGKPYREALAEIEVAASMFDWSAEEGRRSYGRIIPSRERGAVQMVLREPIGPIAAFASWNAPMITPARKIAGALAAGCSVILKASEETPASALAIGQIAYECGLPEGVLSVVIGEPTMISGKLMASDVIRGVTFTGSTAIGKLLTSQAVASMKRPIMELGGHAPVLVMDDIDIEETVRGAVAAKFRNAGQICVSPTRFLVHENIYADFVDCFAEQMATIVVGDAFDATTTMGPLANARRIPEMEKLLEDARERKLNVVLAGERVVGDGNYFQPTLITGVTTDARVSNIEPFGPIAALSPINNLDDALRIANRLPFGLASYVHTNNLKTAQRCIAQIEAGSVIVNGWRASLPETPFGGHKDSGLASEGGIEGLAAFQNIKYVYQS